MWFTEIQANRVGRVAPDGVVTEFTVPTADSLPTDIVAGPDGAMWFIEIMPGVGSRVARVSMTGLIRESAFTSGDRPELMDLAVGPDGNIWMTVSYSPSAIVRLGLS
jgi:virginiamycin B lyase